MANEIRLPSSVSGWALAVSYTALMGMFTWMLSLDREVSRIAATQKQTIDADAVLRATVTQEIANRRDDMLEVRRMNENIRDLIQRHTESTSLNLNGKR